jgi:hypothetical protein
VKPYRYIGPHDELNVNGVGVVAQGKELEVPDDLASEFDARDDFEAVKPAKKAASGRDDSQEG